MKHTLAKNKIMFNVKSYADSKHLDDFVDGDFGVFAIGSDTSLPKATAYAALPNTYRIVGKVNGKLLFGLSEIEKGKESKFVTKSYVAPVINKWKGVIKDDNCIESVTFKVGIEDDRLMRRDGFTWSNTDYVVELSPKEISDKCECSLCTGADFPVYQNNILTQMISEKINSFDSEFYESEVMVENIVTYADLAAINAAIPAPTEADHGILTDATGTNDTTGAAATGIWVVKWDGSAWVALTHASTLGELADVDTLVKAFKSINIDTDATNDGPYLELHVYGKEVTAGTYKDIDGDYTFPRGVKLQPSATINSGKSYITFTETQALVYEIGAGYDLRAEEWDTMSLYTNLNYKPVMADHLASNELIYQFENNTNYDTISYEWYTDKVESNNGDKRSFAVLLGSSVAHIINELQNTLKPV